jgi:hypothetical protein
MAIDQELVVILDENSAVLRTLSSLLPSAQPEITRLPANSEAPLLPVSPLQ